MCWVAATNTANAADGQRLEGIEADLRARQRRPQHGELGEQDDQAMASAPPEKVEGTGGARRRLHVSQPPPR